MKGFQYLGFALGLLTACSSMTPHPSAPPRSPVMTATPAPTMTPTPTPAPVEIPPPPPPPEAAELPETDLDPPLIRVLLKKGREIVLPGTGRPWFLSSGDKGEWMWGPLKISASSGAVWWQLGAFEKPESAGELVGRVRATLGEDALIDEITGEDGLIRVRVRQGVDGKDFLASAGFPGAFRVAVVALLRVEASEKIFESSNEILLKPGGKEFISLGKAKYRGRMIVRSASEKVLLINELNLESYLRGVVPGEMGPSAFPALEALKAQAVAARTYVVAHLGGYRDQGYDICATPACQVYGGAGIEHPLSDRALRESSGIIATWEGQPIDAMYTSTCGGHTEDSSFLFSGRQEAYLRGVPCAFDSPLTLKGIEKGRPWLNLGAFRAELALEILGLSSGASPGELLNALAAKRGLKEEIPAIENREDFSAYLLKISGLEGASRNLTPETTAGSRLLFLADLFNASLSPAPAVGWESSWADEAAAAAMEMDGILRRDSGELLADSDGGARIYPKRADSSEELPDNLPLWEAWGRSLRKKESAELLPGTSLERYREGDRVVALVFSSSGGAGEADRRSAWREWVRETSLHDLARRLQMPSLEKLMITRRSPSGRVVGLEAVDSSGRRKSWKGFKIRRVLDLPETLFDMLEFRGPGGEKMLRFLGRGWGHGIGLCQNGAYGLARAGKSYDEILQHYYTGIKLERLP